uniref:L1 transposable element RRM domain-containing protein n=1 Tax=Amphiprion percula TaxID=161767 RepID=A0A3P8U073_AMPPE
MMEMTQKSYWLGCLEKMQKNIQCQPSVLEIFFSLWQLERGLSSKSFIFENTLVSVGIFCIKIVDTMSSTNKSNKTSNRRDNAKAETEENLANHAKANHASADVHQENIAELMAELKRIGAANHKGHTQTKASLDRLELSVLDLNAKILKQEERQNEAEKRISETEDRGMRHERTLRYLLRRELDLTAHCEDLQNRLRRNNLRIYQVPEGSEQRDMLAFIPDLIRRVLNKPDMELKIERAHRALVSRPRDPTAPPRSIIVRFLDFTVKENVLRLAWSQKKMLLDGKPIYFDNDYSPELQRKRARVRSMIKQLKAKGVKVKCLYPAQLKIHLETGDKSFSTVNALQNIIFNFKAESDVKQ